MMRAGISYSQFDALAKRAFVEEALAAPDPRARATNTSRVAVRTGLSRKEVARVRIAMAQGVSVSSGSTFQSGHPARALQIWHSSAEFQDENGSPMDLSFDGEEPNFVTLVKRVGGDVPAGAVRAELLAAGGMVELSNGNFRVQKRFFVPSSVGEDLIVGFAFIVSPVLETLCHNLENPSGAYIQRAAYSDRLPEDALEEFRVMSHQQAELLMQSVDKWLAEREDDSNQTEDVERRVGLGVFYFERPGATKR